MGRTSRLKSILSSARTEIEARSNAKMAQRQVRTKSNTLEGLGRGQRSRPRHLIGTHEFSMREGGQHDVFVGHSLLAAAFGAPLAETDAVTVAVAFDEADVIRLGDGLHEAAQKRRCGLV